MGAMRRTTAAQAARTDPAVLVLVGIILGDVMMNHLRGGGGVWGFSLKPAVGRYHDAARPVSTSNAGAWHPKREVVAPRSSRRWTVRWGMPRNDINDDSFEEAATAGDPARPTVRLIGADDSTTANQAVAALRQHGFGVVQVVSLTDEETINNAAATYQVQRATGMLQRRSASEEDNFPRWIPLVPDQDRLLVQQGWSFLDVDDQEQLSPYDVDAAQRESTYTPQWGRDEKQGENVKTIVSSLGFDITPLHKQEVLSRADQYLHSDLTRRVLLEGATDPPYTKVTHNGYSLQGQSLSDILPGIFACALTGLPLFATTDLTSAANGWLSFARPLAPDHVRHVAPSPTSWDQRTEVVCAQSYGHLGHYFGQDDGYCINASVLNYFPRSTTTTTATPNHQVTDFNLDLCPLRGPYSYRSWWGKPTMATNNDDDDNNNNLMLRPAVRLLWQVLQEKIPTATVVLGAGCFWHVETALCRLPGVVDTIVGYAGGHTSSATMEQVITYQQVCGGDTGHAEVVLVTYDPTILSHRQLLDCFLALHDPTKVRAHGKHAAGTGQYRSCIFFIEDLAQEELVETAHQVLRTCAAALGKELSTELQIMAGLPPVTPPVDKGDDSSNAPGCTPWWFHHAEERHQRHDEKRYHQRLQQQQQRQQQVPVPAKEEDNPFATLDLTSWIERYTRRTQSVLGSGQQITFVDDEDEEVVQMRFLI